MSKLYLYHISFFDSLFKGLHSNGVAVDKLIQQTDLKKFNLKNPDIYLPLGVSYNLFEKVKKTQGIDCISSEFYNEFSLDDLGEYGEFLCSCPNLKAILTSAIKYDYLSQTNSEMSLRVEGPITWFCMNHKDSISQGREISERINVAMIIQAFRMTIGDDWTPLEMRISSEDAYWLENHFSTVNFNVTTNYYQLEFGFKTEELFMKNKSYKSFHIKDKDLVSMKGITLNVLNSTLTDNLPTLDEFVDFFGLSKSTIIREYHREKTSFKEIVENQKFEKALFLLQNQHLSIDSIGKKLGYSTSSNFARAFKKWTNTTPKKYRRLNS